ncbi:hypothetical protein B0H66DRAFT_276154 [Apodospora peruviana]|uniref:Smr domain-containing protein n=1 Tax=Apodospora peruviana TaxID=516989 RepID=A0AAE0I0B8_9PEZI|nr:hypothetical protein B0H66DRAFT_276154 [Apodospora peruviana]
MGTAVPGSACQDNTTEELLKKLINEFGTVLDETLIISLANDWNIQTQYDELRSILLGLAETAAAEEATGFDPSGLSGENVRTPDEIAANSESSPTTDNTTVVSDSGYMSDPNQPASFSDNQANLTDEDKIEGLRLIFGLSFKDHTLKLILKKAGGDLGRAFDELINRQALLDAGDLPKSVDGFYVSDGEGYFQGKGKSGGVKAKNGGGGKKKQLVSLDYSVVSPIDDDLELEGAKGPIVLSSTTKRPLPQTVGSSRTTSPVMGFGSGSGSNSSSNLRASATALSSGRKGPWGRQGAIVYTERARAEAQTSAANALRMANQAVDEQLRKNPFQIDLHGVTVLDGVKIAKQRVWNWWDGLDSEWGTREAQAKRNSFTIVTGVGHHSANGVSRLRQAVGVMLKGDEWKVEAGTGLFVVVGRVK